MRYMLLIYSNAESWDALSEAERDQLGRDHVELYRELSESGQLVSSAALADPINTRTVRVRDQAATTTDGPYVESKEHLAGYYVVECDSAEEATALAARVPDAAILAVELRPVMDTSGLEM